MSVLSFFVPGIAVPKGRPRLGKGGRVYTPPETMAWERTVAIYARQAISVSRQSWPLVGGPPLAVTLTFFLPTAKPKDVDNLSKAVLDALNGVAYLDDSQIAELHVFRRLKAEQPRVVIQIQDAPNAE